MIPPEPQVPGNQRRPYRPVAFNNGDPESDPNQTPGQQTQNPGQKPGQQQQDPSREGQNPTPQRDR